MKRILFLFLFSLLCLYSQAQEKTSEKYIFTTVDSIPITSIKNQNQSGTCWSFSALSFFESELLAAGKGEYDLSEMYVVHKTMQDRAKASVRMHGDISFSPGGCFYDVIYCFDNYGIVPENIMPGILYDSPLHDHSELSAVAEAYVNAIAKGRSKKISDVWQNGLSAIYDSYLGVCPDTFTYNGKLFSPVSFSQSLGLDMSDYVSLTSYTHHPYYQKFILEIQDNWRWAESYNLPIEELVAVVDGSIKAGHPVAWGADTVNLMDALNRPCAEKEITQETRQKGFDSWETTDDHGMLIFGIAKDQNDKEYYMVKNSWGDSNGYQGIWYASKAFFSYKTMNILVNKKAIPKEIRKKLGIK